MTLKSGDRIIINGRPVVVDDEVIKKFVDGDALFGLSDGQILHVDKGELALVDNSVSAARTAFRELGNCTADQISLFYSKFAQCQCHGCPVGEGTQSANHTFVAYREGS